MGSIFEHGDVLIGGAGIAAAAAAVRLCSLGFWPHILATNSRILPGAEAIPESGLALFAELGMEDILAQAGREVAEGFENDWNERKKVLRPGRWIHVERSALAKAAIQEAVKRGALLSICKSLPALEIGSDSVVIAHQGTRHHFAAAIDATGRLAVWSRPIRRIGNQVADIFSVFGESPLRGQVVRCPGAWAYRIGLKDAATVAMIGENGGGRKQPDTQTQEALRITGSRLEFTGRRAAFPQWSERPVQRRRLAIGDAALAYDPIAGQGICFALSSALAAGAVIHTWINAPAQSNLGECFYRDFVAQRRQRHASFLDELRGGHTQEELHRSYLPNEIVFSGQTARTGLQIASRIVEDEAVVLPDGTSIRWLGGLDLLRIRDLASRPVRASAVIETLEGANFSCSHITAVLHWCLQRKLIRAAG
jgi:flavin-dependent dehydrogenase